MFPSVNELRAKFGKEESNVTKVMRSYDLLPVVLYVGNGSDFLQMNHGGMEPGYDPRKLLAAAGSPRFHLLGKLRQREYHAARPGWLGCRARRRPQGCCRQQVGERVGEASGWVVTRSPKRVNTHVVQCLTPSQYLTLGGRAQNATTERSCAFDR